MDARFRDRREAGQILGQYLSDYMNTDPLILGLPRGGVPVACEVARALHAPLDVFLVRKLGVPGRKELAMGAIASGNVQVLNRDVVDELGIPEGIIQHVADTERQELERRLRAYRGDRPALVAKDRTVILVDDGLATGATMRAAIAALRQQSPTALVVAVPVAPPHTVATLRPLVDDMVVVLMPEPFWGVGAWYEDFRQVSDDEVAALLDSAQEDDGRSVSSEQ